MKPIVEPYLGYWVAFLLIFALLGGIVMGFILKRIIDLENPRPCVCMEQPAQPPTQSKRLWPDGALKGGVK